MKRLEITLQLSIDEVGHVKMEQCSFVYKGCNDPSLFVSTNLDSDAIVTTEEVVKPLNITSAPRQEVVLALSKLGFNQEESEAWALRLTPKRILDVASWVQNKNGVGSPKKLAEKLFALG
jgi:hypothetical protein